MAQREGLRFEGPIESDTASLWPAVKALLDAGVDVHCLRDLTRGGLATALVEIADAHGGTEIAVDEAAVPVSDPVRGACEVLGLDPMYVANEGRFVGFVPGDQAARAVEILRRLPEASGASRIGTVTASSRGLVTLRTPIGARRVVDMLTGEQLPRIC
jgi:hydrogenase expression/formation protein HypE